jgi:glycosyltransferase involved in cell wall biosynthesis
VTRISRRPRVLVAARPYDLSEAETDGFVIRHRALLEALSGYFDLAVLGLRPPHDDAVVAVGLGHDRCDEIAIPAQSNARWDRSKAALRSVITARPAPWEHEIARIAAETRPAVVVTLGPWLDVEYRMLFRKVPTIHLFEEDLTRMADLAPQSRRGRLFRRAEIFGHGRSSAQPRVAVVINELESAAARRRYPRARIVVLPYTLPSPHWPLADSPSQGVGVIVAGNLAQERNSEGLVQILDEVTRRGLGHALRFRLASRAGLHPSLERFLMFDWVEHDANPGELYERYRDAAVALVPATRVTGTKSTVLQAWAAGCPVVCFPASARTLGESGRDAVLCATSPSEVVTALLGAINDEQLRSHLVDAGFDQLKTRFDADTHTQRFIDLVTELAMTPPSPQRPCE